MTLFPPVESVRVLVFGDSIIDVYLHGETSRISREAPIPITDISHRDIKPGGAANVAANIAAIGAQCTLMGFVGDDPDTEALKQLLSHQQVHCEWEVLPQQKTRQSVRIISRNQQLLRTDFRETLRPHNDLWLEHFNQQLTNTDIVVLSDYSGGSLDQAEKLIAAANKQGIPIIVDPTGSDYTPYYGATIDRNALFICCCDQFFCLIKRAT